MIDKLLDFSIKHRWLVLIAAVALGGLGLYNYQRLPIDAVPDITNVQVQVNSSDCRIFAARSGTACHVSD